MMAPVSHNKETLLDREGDVVLHRAASAAVLLTLSLAGLGITVRSEETAQEARIEATIARYGNSMAVGHGSLWIKTSDKLTRISLADNSITDISIGGFGTSAGWFGSIAVGSDAIWLPDPNTIYKIDAKTNQVTKQIAADLPGGGQIEFGEGALWAITGGGRTLLKRYSAETGAEEATVDLPSRSTGVLIAFGSVWIIGAGNEELYRVDPKSNKIAATIDVGSRPGALAAGEGSVWLLNEGDGTVQRIDGTNGKLVATIDTGTVGKGAIDVGGGFVWVNSRLTPIIQIDPRTDLVRGKIEVETGEYSTIRYGGGSLWISGASIRRIKPPD
jgi:virginiamycin B lyase